MASAGLNDSNRGNASDFIGECTVSRSCEPCMKTNTSKAATMFCKDCNEFLCETCRNPHIAYKSGQHCIIIIQERESSQMVVDMKGMDLCQEHGKGFEFFCEDHSKLCCTTCVITHRKCDKLDEIASIALQKGAEIDNLKQCLLKLESDADANVIECKLSEKQLLESIRDISKEVDDLGDRFTKKNEDAKREFLTKANALKRREAKRLNDKTKVKDEINEILSIFSAISKQGTFQQLYIFSKQIDEKYKKIGSDINEQRSAQFSTKVTFSYPRELSSLLEMGNNFFKVNLEGTVEPDNLAAPAAHIPEPADHGHVNPYANVYAPEATAALKIIQKIPEKGMICIARNDFKAADDSDITFNRDDVITNVQKIDGETDWWMGTAPDGSRGMFPADRVEEVTELGYYRPHRKRGATGLPPQRQLQDLEVERNSMELLKKLRSGCFVDVWMGKWRKRVDVAVKIQHPDQITPEAFLEEAKLMHHLRHPKIVQYLAVCTKSEPIWIIKELMENGSLLGYLRNDKGKKITLHIIVDIAGQIADGMAYLEKNNIIHRDLCAANILVGKNNAVKVASFKLARMTGGNEYVADVKGTMFRIKWTAIDTALSRKFSIKSDVWPYGVLLYELISFGKVPYPGMTNDQVLNFLFEGNNMPLPTGGPIPCPEPFYQHMLKCWNRLPENRPTFDYLHDFFSIYEVFAERGYEIVY